MIPPQYDSLLGEGRRLGRGSARGRRARAFGRWGEPRGGVPTTRELAIDKLRSEEFAEGRYSTGFLEQAARGCPRSCRDGRWPASARRQALFVLYQWDVTGQPLASLFEGEVDPWARLLAEAVVAEAGELDRRITAAAEGWTADRLGAVERNTLRIAVHELNAGDVPQEVGDQRGGRAGQALRDRRGRQAGKRHSRQDPARDDGGGVTEQEQVPGDVSH